MSAVAASSPSVGGTRTAGDVVRTGLRGVGQLLITLGVVILLFVVYELYWTDLGTIRAQSHLNSVIQHQIVDIENQGTPGAATVPPINQVPIGQGIAVLYIPRFGAGYHEVVVQGAGLDQLAEGPGHYAGTAFPGQVGNFYVAGHRTTHSEPFNKLDELELGDNIYFETARDWYVYRLENIPGTSAGWQENVLPSDLPISYPVPDQPNPNLKPTKRVMTLSTCNPEYSATHRLVVHGILVFHHKVAPGYRPPAVVNGPLPAG